MLLKGGGANGLRGLPDLYPLSPQRTKYQKALRALNRFLADGEDSEIFPMPASEVLFLGAQLRSNKTVSIILFFVLYPRIAPIGADYRGGVPRGLFCP